jgi:PAS domain S-box-containing protein
MRIRTRIIVAVLAVVAVANVGYLAYFIDRGRTEATALLNERIGEASDVLRVVIAGPLYDGNREQLDANLDSFFRNPDLLEIGLREYRGDIALTRRRDAPAGGDRLERTVVIPRGIDQLGEIRLVYTTANIERRLAQSRNELLLFAGVLMLGLLVVVVLVARGLARPIHRLAVAAQAMADGKLDQHIAVDSVAELAILAESFDRMRGAIRSQIADLAENNRQLSEQIAHRREAELARDRLVSVLEATTDVVGMADPQGRVLYLNRAGRTLGGFGDTPVEQLEIARLHPPGSGALILGEGIPAARRDGTWSGETLMIGADGREIPMSQVILAHKDADGNVLYLSTIMRDIGESKRAAAEIRSLNQDLERRVAERTAELAEANRELESFTSSVAHDLRAPLRGIDGFGKLLDDRLGASLEPDARGYLQRIRASAQRMGRLIDELLKFSRIGRSELRRQWVDLDALARSVADDLQRTAPERQVQWHIAPGLRAWADPELIHVVIENLLGNAWKYSGKAERATIEFGVERDAAGNAEFFVRDNGAGFDMAHAQMLFQPFRRLHGQHEFEGTGIGLATVQRIVARHGGTIRAEAEVGRGAVFRFTLPSHG